MIRNISIQNFRCFENLEMTGFKTLNLIGGKNNSGKTSLLEAIYCMAEAVNYEHILEYRYGDLDKIERRKSLFFNYNVLEKVFLMFENAEFQKIGFYYNYETIADVNDISVKNFQTSLIFSKNAQLPNNLNLSAEFDKLDIKGESEIILEALQIIDQSIEEIKTYASKPNMLYLRKKDEKRFMPLNDFGDALQKIVRYIITLTTFEQNDLPRCLLIDEIENGLHYTAQEEFWKMLFRLAKQYKIQIFATSHSLEMMTAFNKVAYQTEFEQDAVYFELSKTLKTNQIIANSMNMEMLRYDIIKNNPFRGE